MSTEARDPHATAEPLGQTLVEQGLPVPPAVEIRREDVLEGAPEELSAHLAPLRGDGDRSGYWVLRREPEDTESQREALVNLDTEASLNAALQQLFSRENAPSRVIVQRLPGRRAAGVLFTRHPVRQDLDHTVIEGVVETGGAEQERLILHADGQVAWRSTRDSTLLHEVGADAFHHLGEQLRQAFERPQACEWVFDGERLWLLQSLPVGSLPEPQEAWCRRAGFGIWNQAVSPLWYTLVARWLKTGFWRPWGERLGWKELSNVEPCRRLHGHIYANSLFFERLLREQDSAALREVVPPAWRPRRSAPGSSRWRLDRLRPLTAGVRLRLLERRWRALDERIGETLQGDETWRLLMKLDAVGEQLEAVEGWLACVALPRLMDGRAPARLEELLTAEELVTLRTLGTSPDSPAGTGEQPATARAPSSEPPPAQALAGGDDPVFPRHDPHHDSRHDLRSDSHNEENSSVEALRALSPQRRERLMALPGADTGERLLQQRGRARLLRHRLGDSLRRLLQRMALLLVEAGRLERTEDIHVLYFDELWKLWQQPEEGRGPPGAIGERKLRYMANAWHGAPDWIIDQVAYGVRVDQSQHPVLDGRGLVKGQAQGPARRIYSGWALEQVRPGEILVLDQCDPRWLPWLCLAEGLVLVSRDPLDPAAALARALDIPAVIGVDDAMHCLVDEVEIHIDGEAGTIRTGAGND